jgi:hypothetical protein
MPQVAPLHPWEWPSAPWERVHADFAGPFMDSMFLVLVCAHSKWLEVVQIKTLSGEFENFTKQNGIKHYKSATFHPATNGLVERIVQTFKNSMRAMKQDNKILSHKIANFLLNYRNTPQ